MNLKIRKKNEVYLKVETEPHINVELSEYFTFDVPNAKYMPQFRNRVWDGKIRLYSPGTGELYCGLVEYLEEWCNERGYTYEYDDCKFYGHPHDVNEFVSPEAVVSFVKSLGMPHKVRDYQYRAIYEALKHNRRLLLSPTASGKSLMIYSIIRYHVNAGRKMLLVVPTTSLVEQMYKDFEDYGWNAAAHCHKIYAGRDKYGIDADVVITTWQSIYKEDKKWFNGFDGVIVDEAHLAKAKSLTGIMTKLHDCKYRIGFTGTLDGSYTNKLVLEGIFGRCNQVTKTNELMQQGHLSRLKIKVLLLKHKFTKFESYQDEIDYIISHPGRNKLIRNLCRDLKGNTLVLFSYVEKHGDVLYDLINSKVGDTRKVFFIHGGVDTEEREAARQICETEQDAIIVASYGTFSTGINIRNLHNVIFASPSKSRVRNLQSIGRILRKGENKNQATLYDIADDISSNNLKNFTLNHLFERVKIYNEEKFDYEIIEVRLKDSYD
jgi:superfamily II DNA or RNA helicase